MSIDLKDRKILYQFDIDARQSFSQIAKKVRLSKEVVQYRVRRLQMEGVIKQFMPIIDTNKLGYTLYRCFVKCQNLDVKKERSIIAWLKPRVGWVVDVRGRWDFNIAIWTRTIHEFMEFWTSFATQFSDCILEYSCNPIPTMWFYRKGWLLPAEKAPGPVDIWGGQSASVSIDALDRRILEEIVVDARKSSLEISRRLDVSEGTVRNRLRRLEQSGVILRYVAQLDISKLGMRYIKLHFDLKQFDVRMLARIRAYACTQPNIVYANEAIGGHLLEFDLHVASYEQLYGIIDGFRETFPSVIKTFEFFEYLEEHKFEYLPREKNPVEKPSM